MGRVLSPISPFQNPIKKGVVILRAYVFTDAIEELKRRGPTSVAYCYNGKDDRKGSILFLESDASPIIINPYNYVLRESEILTSNIDRGYRDFELWAFIEDLDEENFDIRQEAVNVLFDVYCSMYQYIPRLREFPFNIF